jgi:hypothetical protein
MGADARLRQIRERSAELWRVAQLPKGSLDPQTGLPAPSVITHKSDEEVKFLLEQIDRLQDDVSRLEEVVDRVCVPVWREDNDADLAAKRTSQVE